MVIEFLCRVLLAPGKHAHLKNCCQFCQLVVYQLHFWMPGLEGLYSVLCAHWQLSWALRSGRGCEGCQVWAFMQDPHEGSWIQKSMLRVSTIYFPLPEKYSIQWYPYMWITPGSYKLPGIQAWETSSKNKLWIIFPVQLWTNFAHIWTETNKGWRIWGKMVMLRY
jgi:hypothetical protein